MAAFCPILKSSDILEVMRQLEIPIVEEDLAKPQPQRVQMWYEAFLFILKGISLDQLGTNTDIDMVDITDYPETHGDDVFLVSFYIQVQWLIRARMAIDVGRAKLMKEVGMEDFTLRDFIKPEKIRIQRILSSICNFAMFRDDRMPILEKYTLKWEQATQRNEKLRAQRTEIEELIEEIKQ
ncbi:kinetochore-associated Ndc80 complex subunit nuf2, partial [Spiromyces aspiralis]